VHRLALLLIVAASCGGKTTANTGSGSAALYAKKVSIKWGIEPGDKTSSVFIAMTDEKGAQTSFPLGDYEGECRVIKPAPAMQAVSAVACNRPGGTVVELDASVRGTIDPVVVILMSKTPPGSEVDPLSREEVRRVAAPPGAKVEAELQ
jgi:hypothetical protein